MADVDPLYTIVEVRQEAKEFRANELLGRGWIVLKVLAARDEGEYAIYVLGRPSSVPA